MRFGRAQRERVDHVGESLLLDETTDVSDDEAIQTKEPPAFSSFERAEELGVDCVRHYLGRSGETFGLKHSEGLRASCHTEIGMTQRVSTKRFERVGERAVDVLFGLGDDSGRWERGAAQPARLDAYQTPWFLPNVDDVGAKVTQEATKTGVPVHVELAGTCPGPPHPPDLVAIRRIRGRFGVTHPAVVHPSVRYKDAQLDAGQPREPVRLRLAFRRGLACMRDRSFVAPGPGPRTRRPSR